MIKRIVTIGLCCSLFHSPAIAQDRAQLVKLWNAMQSEIAQQRYTEALTTAKKLERGSKKLFGANSLEYASVLNQIGALQQLSGRIENALGRFRQALELYDKLGVGNTLGRSSLLNNIGTSLLWLRRYDDAIASYRKGLEIRETVSREDKCPIAESLNNLAHALGYLRRNEEAKRLLGRAKHLARSSSSSCRRILTSVLQNDASTLEALGKFSDAETSIREAIRNESEASTKSRSTRLGPLTNRLGVLLSLQGSYDKAAAVYQRALATYKALPEVPPAPYAATLQDFARNEIERKRYRAARRLLTEAAALRTKVLGPQHPDVGRTYSDLAELAYREKRFAAAFAAIQKATEIFERHNLAGREPSRLYFQRFLKIAFERYSRTSDEMRASYLEQAFVAAQRAMQSQIGDTVERAAKRLAEDDRAIADLLRKSDDIKNRLASIEHRLLEVYSRPLDQRTGDDRELLNTYKQLNLDLDASTKRLSELSPALADYFFPSPLSLTQVSSQILSKDEALILALPLHDAVYVFLVTTGGARWTKNDVQPGALNKLVEKLRSALDPDAAQPRGRKEFQFDIESAHRVYEILFRGLEDPLRGTKRLLFATRGALESLPLHVLVTERPTKTTSRSRRREYRSIAWLAKTHAITTLPAISNLKTLRAKGRKPAPYPIIAFANPLLDGDRRKPLERRSADLAASWTSCEIVPRKALDKVYALRGPNRPRLNRAVVPASELRALAPLPETAYEACSVADSSGGDMKQVHLAERTSEDIIRKLNDSGELEKYRIVQFATHAAVAGELKLGLEPGLVLTPPEEVGPRNDGYLSRTEIFELKLNADWVVLSACNTAAPGEVGAEGLSGLAQAFFHAGTRAMLVSHWYVDSIATTQIVTAAFRALDGKRGLDKAEALQTAMLAYLRQAKPERTHPRYWTPFVVVGGGIHRN